MRDLNLANKKYWRKYKAGSTPGVTEEPGSNILSLFKKGDRILDAGTGQGKLADSLSNKGYKVSAIDINSNEIVTNRARKTKVFYSKQDITQRTTFPDNYFKLIIFRYVLTNIHKQDWKKLLKEVNRILKKDGYLWVVEPLVSKSYGLRYKLSSKFLDDPHAFFVFKDHATARKINTRKELQVEIDNKNINRIVRHYSLKEFSQIFTNYRLLKSRKIWIKSDAGYLIDTFVGFMKRKQD